MSLLWYQPMPTVCLPFQLFKFLECNCSYILFMTALARRLCDPCPYPALPNPWTYVHHYSYLLMLLPSWVLSIFPCVKLHVPVWIFSNYLHFLCVVHHGAIAPSAQPVPMALVVLLFLMISKKQNQINNLRHTNIRCCRAICLTISTCPNVYVSDFCCVPVWMWSVIYLHTSSLPLYIFLLLFFHHLSLLHIFFWIFVSLKNKKNWKKKSRLK